MEPHRETESLPDQPTSAAAGPDLITALRVVGREPEFPLLNDQRTFSLGSATSCDIVLDHPHISGFHCSLNRRGQRIRITDQHSRNGTVFGGRREQSFDIGPGDTFTVASSTLLALNDEMRLSRSTLIEVLGFDDPATVDGLLATAVKGQHLIFSGEPGCDQLRLARAVHHASQRSHYPVFEVVNFPTERSAQRAILDAARNGTLMLTLKESSSPPDDAFRAMLLSADFRVRLLVSAPSISVVVHSLGLDAVSRMQQVRLRPLRERVSEIASLLDRMFVERRASVRVADFRRKNQQALQAHSWPLNIMELREAADRLVALAVHESVTKAAAALEIPRTTLLYWAEEKMHLELPLRGE
jgi:pSer/pThr/pTyr-binding forkhead associated (FHA) protein